MSTAISFVRVLKRFHRMLKPTKPNRLWAQNTYKIEELHCLTFVERYIPAEADYYEVPDSVGEYM